MIMAKTLFILPLFCFFFTKIQAQILIQSLDYYLKQGLQNSPLLNDYQNQINSLAIDSLLIKAAQKPKVDANAQLLYAPIYGNFGYDEAITNGGNYMGIIGVSQNFLNRRELRNIYEGINVQKRSLSNTSKISNSELVKTITNQYLSSFADFSDLSFNKASLKLIKDQMEITRKLVESGIYKQTDFISLLIEAQSQEITISQLNNQYQKDIRLLNQVCGINDMNLVDLSLPEIQQKKMVDPFLSPLFFQYKIDSLKITNQKAAIDVRYRPKLNWFADAGVMSARPSTLNQHLGYSVGLNFSIPLYDGKQRKLEYQKILFSENTRTYYESFFKRQYNQQIMQLNNDLTATRETLEQMKKQANTAEQLMGMVKALLNTGNISITDVINAVKNYNNIIRNLNQLQIKVLQIINELNYWMQQ